MPTEWSVDDFPSDAVARSVLAAFIAVVCNADPKLKERLELLLSSQLIKATEPASQQALNDAVAWVQRLSTGGTL